MAKFLSSGKLIGVKSYTDIGEDTTTLITNMLTSSTIPALMGSEVTPETEMLSRETMNGSLLDCPGVIGTETAGVSIKLELGVGNFMSGFIGNPLYEATLGQFTGDIAAISSNTIGTGTSTGYGLYRLAKPDTDRKYLHVRETLKGGDTLSIDTTGVVFDSVTFNLPTAQIATADFSGKGINYKTGDHSLNDVDCGSTDVFVVKSATLYLDSVNKSTEVRDVTITVNNENTERSAIGSDGISDRITTKKSVEVSFSMDVEDMSEFTAYQNNTQASLYIKLESSGGGNEIHFYMPNLRRTQVSKSDDGNIISQSITMSAYNLNEDDDALYIAVK